MEPIEPNGLRPPGLPGAGGPGGLSGGPQRAGASAVPAFKEMLQRYLNDVSSLQLEADKAVRDLSTGATDNLHQVIVAMSEADLSFRLMMQVRNKLLEAYKEIMRMQV
ncbi:MAG: flagellar hook-basal body complex protein FliE [Planctomycetota bacterium]|jgi:flagellar hook-basal body complex protein FliE